MTQPTAYDRQYDFDSYQSSNPTDPLPSGQIEAELNAVEITLDAILANLAIIQRDDTELANLSVGQDQLKAEVTFGLNTQGNWATSTAYSLNDAVFEDNGVYYCTEAHTSGTFSTDLAAVKWTVLIDLSVSVDAAAASAVATAADAIATAADAIATAADAVSTASDAASADASRILAEAAAAGIYWKDPVLNATTANVTLSGEQTIDGVLTSASRILVKDQTASEENGVYVTGSGAWSRATPLDTWDEHIGAVVTVSTGTASSDTSWMCTVDSGGTLGTTAIAWGAFGAGDVRSSNNGSEFTEATFKTNLNMEAGVDYQAYDADTAKLDVDQAWTGSQRVTPTAQAEMTLLDMDAAQDWDLTPAAADELSFTNITAGQRGMIKLDNSSAYAITKAAAVHCDSDFLATVSAAGIYIISYWSDDGTITYVMNSQALAT
jgi:hypothetical protein